VEKGRETRERKLDTPTLSPTSPLVPSLPSLSAPFGAPPFPRPPHSHSLPSISRLHPTPPPQSIPSRSILLHPLSPSANVRNPSSHCRPPLLTLSLPLPLLPLPLPLPSPPPLPPLSHYPPPFAIFPTTSLDSRIPPTLPPSTNRLLPSQSLFIPLHSSVFPLPCLSVPSSSLFLRSPPPSSLLATSALPSFFPPSLLPLPTSLPPSFPSPPSWPPFHPPRSSLFPSLSPLSPRCRSLPAAHRLHSQLNIETGSCIKGVQKYKSRVWFLI